jgi:hypothetical protein
MDPLTIIGLLAKFGPSLLKSLGAGTDVQKVANTAAAVATAVTGKADINDAAVALSADPALALQYQTQLLTQQTQDEQAYVADKASARARDISITDKTGANNRANWLVAFAVLTISGITGYICFWPVTDEFAKNTLLVILGLYMGELKNIYAFEFGSTRRSADKDSTIASLTDKV